MPVALWWIDNPKLRALREARGLSVVGLARQVTIGPGSLRRMELAAAGFPSWPLNVAAVAAALGVPVEELIGGDVAAFQAALLRGPPPSKPDA